MAPQMWCLDLCREIWSRHRVEGRLLELLTKRLDALVLKGQSRHRRLWEVALNWFIKKMRILLCETSMSWCFSRIPAPDVDLILSRACSMSLITVVHTLDVRDLVERLVGLVLLIVLEVLLHWAVVLIRGRSLRRMTSASYRKRAHCSLWRHHTTVDWLVKQVCRSVRILVLLASRQTLHVMIQIWIWSNVSRKFAILMGYVLLPRSCFRLGCTATCILLFYWPFVVFSNATLCSIIGLNCVDMVVLFLVWHYLVFVSLWLLHWAAWISKKWFTYEVSMLAICVVRLNLTIWLRHLLYFWLLRRWSCSSVTDWVRQDVSLPWFFSIRWKFLSAHSFISWRNVWSVN